MPTPEDDQRERRNWIKTYASYMEVGLMLPVSTFTGYAIGYLLDKWLGTTYLAVVFLILGSIGGIINLIRRVSREKP